MSIADQLRRVVQDEVERRLVAVKDDVIYDVLEVVPRVTGALASITFDEWRQDGTKYVGRIRAGAMHASWVEEGTGIYGPTGQRIYPVRARFLVFPWDRGPRGPGIYAYRSVAGQPPQPFFRAPMPARFRSALERFFG